MCRESFLLPLYLFLLVIFTPTPVSGHEGDNKEEKGATDRAQRATVICIVVLFFKVLITLIIQGGKKTEAGTRPPEDSKLGMGIQGFAPDTRHSDGVLVTESSDAHLRWERIVANDIENIPIGCLVALAALLTAKSAEAHSAFIYLFAIFRVIHTVVYAHKLQPWRSLTWFGGVFPVAGLALNGLAGALDGY